MHKLVALPLLVLTVTVALAGVVASGGISAAGRDGWQAIVQIAASLEREAAFDEVEQAVARQNRTRNEIAGEVLAGRVGLLDAAARFRELNRRLPCRGHGALYEIRGDSEGERLCWQVIERVKGQETNPDAPAVSQRLEAELEELLDRDGTVRVPEAGGAWD